MSDPNPECRKCGLLESTCHSKKPGRCCGGCSHKLLRCYEKSIQERLKDALVNLIDVYGMHSIEPMGSYTPVNTGELEEAIHQAEEVLKDLK